MPTNRAAWQPEANVKTLEVRDAPYTSPKDHQLVVKNGAVAINPVDWLLQDIGSIMFNWLKYPFIYGSDISGEVVEVGSRVTRFKVGDRVVADALGSSKTHNTATEGAFQLYTVVEDYMTSPIPSTMSYEEAAVSPLAVSTAACGLFQKDQLGLQLPTISPKPTGKTLIVWGGSTSVGSNAIQLAVAAGYEVFTTASSKNFDFVKKLGASRVFDYRSKTVISDMIEALKGKTTAGAITFGQGSIEACVQILGKSEGNRFIAMGTYPTPNPPPQSFVLPKMMVAMISFSISHFISTKLRGIQSKFIFGDSLAENEVGRAIYEDFLPKALAAGSFVAAPEPQVVGKGLEYINEAFKLQRKVRFGGRSFISFEIHPTIWGKKAKISDFSPYKKKTDS